MLVLDERLQLLKSERRLGLMTHIVLGYPTLPGSIALVRTMIEVGVDFVELQIPFSDPMADGPTIMRANSVALAGGVKVRDCFAAMAELSTDSSVPLLFMSYFNIVYRYGTKRFASDARRAGAAGLIVPDVPLDDEGRENFHRLAATNDLVTIRVVSPASSEERLKKNAENCNGFVYFAHRKGITGARDRVNSDLTEQCARIRQYFPIPLAVGFGISSPDHVRCLKGHADIAVVGSAVIDVLDQEGLPGVECFLRMLVEATVKGHL